jgi:hypothetical protein
VEANSTTPISPSRAALLSPQRPFNPISRTAHLEDTKNPNASHRKLPDTDQDGRNAGNTPPFVMPADTRPFWFPLQYLFPLIRTREPTVAAPIDMILQG